MNTLHWNEPDAQSQDTRYVRIYRADTMSGTYSLIDTINATSDGLVKNGNTWVVLYADATGDPSHWYKVSFVDWDGNESPLSAPVKASYVDEYTPTQLLPNNVIILTMEKDAITDLDGNHLQKDFTFWFTTEYNPLYTIVRVIRAQIGSLLENVYDDDINMAIFQASLEAQEVYEAAYSTTIEINSVPFVVRNWVVCRAQQILVLRKLHELTEKGYGEAKSLGDLRLQKAADSVLPGAQAILKQLEKCMNKWPLSSKALCVQTFIKAAWGTPYPLRYRNQDLGISAVPRAYESERIFRPSHERFPDSNYLG